MGINIDMDMFFFVASLVMGMVGLLSLACRRLDGFIGGTIAGVLLAIPLIL